MGNVTIRLKGRLYFGAGKRAKSEVRPLLGGWVDSSPTAILSLGHMITLVNLPHYGHLFITPPLRHLSGPAAGSSGVQKRISRQSLALQLPLQNNLCYFALLTQIHRFTKDEEKSGERLR
jgi:hypothetical protein